MKKFISSFVSSLVASTAAVAMVTSGAFNPNKDPNGDGMLDFSDATYIYQCLGGNYKPSDLTQLDIDDNGVVSDVDAMYAQMYDAGLIHSETSDNLMRAASYASLSYVGFDANTGMWIKDYMLEVQNSNNTRSGESTESIVDGRVEDWSNRGVAKILVDENGSGYLGSGFVVDKHTIATAAHMVYNNTYKTARTVSDILLFDENGNDRSFTPVEYHIPAAYRMGGNSNSVSGYDFALITVEEDLSDYMSFNLGMVTPLAATRNLPIAIAGFPGSVAGGTGNSDTQHVEYVSYGAIKSLDAKVIHHTADSSGGNSGGPIYTIEELNGKTYYTVVGIHTTGADYETQVNGGVRFDALNLKFFLSNPNIEY